MRGISVTRTAFAFLAVAFFAAPVAARLVGVTAESFENRSLARPPQLAQGWDAFAQTTRYLTDRMPLRAQAVRANTQIWTEVLGTDPSYTRDRALANDQALPFAGTIGAARDEQGGVGLQGPVTAKAGRAGWLYVDLEFKSACDDTISNELLLERWGRLIRAVRAEGRKSVLFAVPDKASVYPEHLPKEYPYDHCALDAKERLWRLLSKDGPAHGVFELRSELLRLKATAGNNLFQRTDMHWTTLGALTLVNAVLDAVGDGIRVEPNEIVARGAVSYTGDLAVAGARSARDKRLEYDIVRADGARRVPGQTLLVCDSFAYKWMRLFKPYFENITYTSLYQDETNIVNAIQRADTVIFEIEEMNLKFQTVTDEGVVKITQALHAR